MIVALLLRISDSARRPAAEMDVLPFDSPIPDDPSPAAEAPLPPAAASGNQETVVVR
jgi:hypothetical protein